MSYVFTPSISTNIIPVTWTNPVLLSLLGTSLSNLWHHQYHPPSSFPTGINRDFLSIPIPPCMCSYVSVHPIASVILFLFWDLLLDYSSLRARNIPSNSSNALYHVSCKASAERTGLCIIPLCFVLICKNEWMVILGLGWSSSWPAAKFYWPFDTQPHLENTLHLAGC